ncbi:hypothetical protein OK074_6580 [Actinobacteria bacterium OK074]|nr:hypothetical protein OK074_6580 [Actinobacteria bacterium OK074]
MTYLLDDLEAPEPVTRRPHGVKSSLPAKRTADGSRATNVD